MSDIVHRLTTATAGSRELDAQIAILAGWRYQPEVRHNFKWHDGQFDRPTVPQYTSSIDAALALVDGLMPKHFPDQYKGWAIDTYSRAPFTCCDLGWKYTIDGKTYHDCRTGEHSIPAIAICLALAKCISTKNTIPSSPLPLSDKGLGDK